MEKFWLYIDGYKNMKKRQIQVRFEEKRNVEIALTQHNCTTNILNYTHKLLGEF